MSGRWRLNAGLLKQGGALPDDLVRKVRLLLASTEMSSPAIAERIGCSGSTVRSINEKFQIRNYAGLRSKWTMTTEQPEKGK